MADYVILKTFLFQSVQGGWTFWWKKSELFGENAQNNIWHTPIPQPSFKAQWRKHHVLRLFWILHKHHLQVSVNAATKWLKRNTWMNGEHQVWMLTFTKMLRLDLKEDVFSINHRNVEHCFFFQESSGKRKKNLPLHCESLTSTYEEISNWGCF